MSLLDGKTVVITGGARGMGREIAAHMDAEGANLILLDRNGDSVAEAASSFRNAQGIALDVSDYAAVSAALNDVPVIDILVNNVGGPINADGDPVMGQFVDSDPAVWEFIYKLNLRAPANLIHISVPKMPRGGRIINIGSDAGRSGSPGEAFYSATKGGVIAFTKSLCKELGASHEISVNCVCPGWTNTPMTQKYLAEKRRRILAGHDIAYAAQTLWYGAGYRQRRDVLRHGYTLRVRPNSKRIWRSADCRLKQSKHQGAGN